MDRELLYVFGTGNAAVSNLYNTCFALRDSDEYFMVDAGGGNGQSYEDYLSGLLILGKKQQRNLRVLDLIECNRRMEKGGETFRVDALVAQAEASADFELAPVFLRVPAVWMHVRNQGTAYTIKGQYGYGQP